MRPNWSTGFDPSLLASAQEDSFPIFLSRFNALATARGLQTGAGHPLVFVSQEHLPEGSPYESHIALTGQVPTRDNLHDRFNALVWLHAPKTKALLNGLQAKELQRLGKSGPRGGPRDAATLIDENLAIIVYRNHPPQLNERDWKGLFWEQRGRWGKEWTIRIFGHALMEKLEKPYLSLTAHCICLETATDEWHDVDGALEGWIKAHSGQPREPRAGSPPTKETLQEATLSPRSLSPLPIMGVPGWHPENLEAVFYDNARVFRPRR